MLTKFKISLKLTEEATQRQETLLTIFGNFISNLAVDNAKGFWYYTGAFISVAFSIGYIIKYKELPLSIGQMASVASWFLGRGN